MSLQAEYLARRLEADGADVVRMDTIPTGKRKPRAFRLPGFLKGLKKVRSCDKVIVFAGSAAGFFVFTASSVLFAKLTGKEVYVLVKGGRADWFYSRWRLFAGPVPRLLIARGLYPLYRVDHAIQAFAVVKEEFPAAELYIAGDGEERGKLERMAAVVDDVYFYGWLGRDKLNELYRLATLLVNCNLYDNHPNSIIEAMIVGLPVVAYSVGGIPYIIDNGRTGVLVPSGDVRALADAIIRLLKNPAELRRISEKARGDAERFYWPFSKAGIVKVFNRYS
jgi:glycosyltransferase involved in cell wall biosynthesis